jgi:VRR-NUC domain
MELCSYLGALAYHVHDARRSNPGFPDCVIITKDNRVLYRELKTRKGRVRPEQQVWLDRLTAAGCDAGIWRPGDMDRIHAELRT